MRACRSELADAEALGAATGGLWQDLKTDLDRLLAARRCQLAIIRALQGQAWKDEGLEPVASGQCGGTMAEDLKRLRTLARLQADLGRLDPLATATTGLWRGLETDTEVADAIVRLQLAIQGARDGRTWADEGFQPIDDSRACRPPHRQAGCPLAHTALGGDKQRKRLLQHRLPRVPGGRPGPPPAALRCVDRQRRGRLSLIHCGKYCGINPEPPPCSAGRSSPSARSALQTLHTIKKPAKKPLDSVPDRPGARAAIRNDKSPLRSIDAATDGLWLLICDGISELLNGRTALSDCARVCDRGAEGFMPPGQNCTNPPGYKP